MKAKPRVFKAKSGWTVELPRFGFADAVIKDGFVSREDAGQVVELASRPQSAHADMNVPGVYR
jgi:hypothetical protein